jgi:tetratricopeptide (TPR) repeat protein
MYSIRQRLFCLWGAGLLLAAGCATDRHPGRSPADAGPTLPAAPTGCIALTQRADAYAHYASGIVYDQRNQPDQADQEYEQAVAAEPGNEQLAVDLARRLMQRHEMDKAVELLTRSAARRHATGIVYGWLGLALDQSGKTNQAVVAYHTAVKRSPLMLLAYHGLARIDLQNKQPQEALKVLDAAARQPKADAEFLVGLAQFLVASGQTKALPDSETKPRVRALLQRAANLKPTNPILLQRMADAYKAIGEVASATRLYQSLLDQHADANPAMIAALREQLFQLYFLSGQRDKAAAQLRELRNADPTNPRVHYLLGSVALEDRRYADAAASFQQALALAPDLEPAYYNLAVAQISLHDPAAALDTLERARTRFKLNFLLEFYTGVAQAAEKQFDEALKSYTSAELLAKAADPSRLDEVFYYQLGMAQERTGAFDDAVKTFRKCMQMAPNDPEPLNYLGYMWADRGVNLEEARALIEKAVKFKPDEPAYLDSLAWVLYKLKLPQAALEPMEKAVRLSEKAPDATLFEHLGDIRAALGQWDAARDAWRKSLALEPNDAVKTKLDAAPAGGTP